MHQESCQYCPTQHRHHMRLFVDVIGVEGGQAGRTSWTRQGQAALEATQGQMDGFFSQLSYKCHLEEVASVGDWT